LINPTKLEVFVLRKWTSFFVSFLVHCFTAGLCAPAQASQIFFFLVLLCGGALCCVTDRSHGLEKQIEILEEHI